MIDKFITNKNMYLSPYCFIKNLYKILNISSILFVLIFENY